MTTSIEKTRKMMESLGSTPAEREPKLKEKYAAKGKRFPTVEETVASFARALQVMGGDVPEILAVVELAAMIVAEIVTANDTPTDEHIDQVGCFDDHEDING